MTDLLLSPLEVKALAGELEQPQRQLEELRRQGFWRVRLSRAHRVILERAHFEAVCAGAVRPGTTQLGERERPALRVVTGKG